MFGLCEPCELRLTFACSLAIGLMGLFWRVEDTDIGLLAFDLDLRNPSLSLFVEMDAFEAAGIVAWRWLVALVLGVACLAQIGESVIGWVAIFVVQVGVGKLPFHIEPRQAMGEMPMAIDTDHDSPIAS